MKKKKCSNSILNVLIIFTICMTVRHLEYFKIISAGGSFDEKFIHKIFGILVIAICLKTFGYRWHDIGFDFHKVFKPIVLGMGMVLFSFFVAFMIELLVLIAQGLTPNIEFFVSGFSLTEMTEADKVLNTLSLLITLIFNVINVVMEEGLFRGLFLNMGMEKYSFRVSNLFSAFLFGCWHYAMPLKAYIDGEIKVSSMIIMCIGYILIAGAMGIQWGMLRRISDVIWVGLVVHFFNNVTTNVIHVVTEEGVDDLQIIRVFLAQIVTFAIVLLWYNKQKGTYERSE